MVGLAEKQLQARALFTALSAYLFGLPLEKEFSDVACILPPRVPGIPPAMSNLFFSRAGCPHEADGQGKKARREREKLDLQTNRGIAYGWPRVSFDIACAGHARGGVRTVLLVMLKDSSP